MKHLKSNSRNLKDIFEQTISARYIAEPFRSFDIDSDASQVKAFMNKHNYDVVGIRRDGKVIGYVKGESLSDGKAGENVLNFDDSERVLDITPLVEVFKKLRDNPRVFVIYLNEVGGIITKGDLQKAPVRMWLFGLVSLLEMQLLRLIRGFYPDELWKKLLKGDRLNEARALFDDRKRRNQAIDLADCLQFCDKKVIVKGSDEIRKALENVSKSSIEKLLKQAEDLRNNLAHAQDIITGFWPGIAILAQEMETLLERAERIETFRDKV